MKRFRWTVPLLPLFLLSPGSLRAQTGMPPETLQGVYFEQKLNTQLPSDILLVDEAGRTVRIGDYLGRKPLILALVYYECPMLCNLVLNGLVNSLLQVPFSAGQEFDILTVSFDPQESPQLASAVKESYLKRYQRPPAEQGWHFLTGSEEQIRRLADTVGFQYRYDVERDQYAHASGVMILTPDGRLSRYFYGIEYRPGDLRLSLIEASQERIGSPVDQLLLYCYHYDPTTGKYGVAIMNLLRLAGILTVAALGTLLFVLLRRERSAS